MPGSSSRHGSIPVGMAAAPEVSPMTLWQPPLHPTPPHLVFRSSRLRFLPTLLHLRKTTISWTRNPWVWPENLIRVHPAARPSAPAVELELGELPEPSPPPFWGHTPHPANMMHPLHVRSRASPYQVRSCAAPPPRLPAWGRLHMSAQRATAHVGDSCRRKAAHPSSHQRFSVI